MRFPKAKRWKSFRTCFDDRAFKTGLRLGSQRIAARQLFPPAAQKPSGFLPGKVLSTSKQEKRAKCPVTRLWKVVNLLR